MPFLPQTHAVKTAKNKNRAFYKSVRLLIFYKINLKNFYAFSVYAAKKSQTRYGRKLPAAAYKIFLLSL